MSGNIRVYVQQSKAPNFAGEILPFNIQPSDKRSGDLGGVFVRFERKYGQVTKVIVQTRAEADILLAALSPKELGSRLMDSKAEDLAP